MKKKQRAETMMDKIDQYRMNLYYSDFGMLGRFYPLKQKYEWGGMRSMSWSCTVKFYEDRDMPQMNMSGVEYGDTI